MKSIFPEFSASGKALGRTEAFGTLPIGPLGQSATQAVVNLCLTKSVLSLYL